MKQKFLVTERLKLLDVFPERAKALATQTGKKAEDFQFIRKYFGDETKDVNIDERTDVSLISTIGVDRDAEVMLPEGAQLDNYRKNPVVLWAHKYADLPVGKNLWIKSGDTGLLAKTLYANHQFAEDVWNLKKDGFLSANSIGFIPIDWTEDPVEVKQIQSERKIVGEAFRIIKTWELLEYSVVPVPCNPEALTLMVKSVKSDTMKDELKTLDEPEKVVPPVPPEELFYTISIGQEKHEGHELREMLLSTKQGIKAFHCLQDNTIVSYHFEQAKGWTIETSDAWVKEHHGKSLAIDDGDTVPIENMTPDYILKGVQGGTISLDQVDTLPIVTPLVSKELYRDGIIYTVGEYKGESVSFVVKISEELLFEIFREKLETIFAQKRQVEVDAELAKLNEGKETEEAKSIETKSPIEAPKTKEIVAVPVLFPVTKEVAGIPETLALEFLKTADTYISERVRKFMGQV